MSYGKHQSFYLKSNWINKAFKAYDRIGMEMFFDLSNYKALGIGKNMFQSLRYWIEALNLVEVENGRHIYTLFGALLSTYDPGCNKNITINLLHYFLCSKTRNNTIFSDTFYWYFNDNNEIISKKKSLVEGLILWDGRNHNKKTSEKTILRDIDCLISLYTREEKEHPEDKNTSLLAPLHLVKKVNDEFAKVSIEANMISYDAIMYILYIMYEEGKILSIDNLLNSKNSIGCIYNLNRVEIIEIIETMVKKGYSIEITRTNNLDTIKIVEEYTSNEFLKACYERGIEHEK